MMARIITNQSGTNVRAEVLCAYCEGLVIQRWVVDPFESGDYLLDLEPVDLSTVG